MESELRKVGMGGAGRRSVVTTTRHEGARPGHYTWLALSWCGGDGTCKGVMSGIVHDSVPSGRTV